MNQTDGFIDPHGGFRDLKSYQIEIGGCGPRQLGRTAARLSGFFVGSTIAAAGKTVFEAGWFH